MSLRRLALTALAIAFPGAAALAQPYTYTFTGMFDFGTPTTSTFVVNTPNPIIASGDYATSSCASDDAMNPCIGTMAFDPNGFMTGQSFIGLTLANSTAYYFFAPNVFTAPGTYSSIVGVGFAGTDPSTGGQGFYGSAGNATLTVAATSAVPEPATVVLMASGLIAVGGIARRSRRKAVAA